MKRIVLSTSGTSVSAVAAINNNVTPVNFSVAVLVTGAVTFKAQYTFDDVYASTFDPATATWIDSATLTGSATKDVLFTAPVTGVRVNQTAGVGSTVCVVLQAGI